MDPINGLGAITALLRKRTQNSSQTKIKANASGAGVAGSTLEQRIRAKIKHARLDKSDASKKRIGELVITEVFAEKFGQQALQEAKFLALARQVYERIDDEPQLKEEFLRFIEQFEK